MSQVGLRLQEILDWEPLVGTSRKHSYNPRSKHTKPQQVHQSLVCPETRSATLNSGEHVQKWTLGTLVPRSSSRAAGNVKLPFPHELLLGVCYALNLPFTYTFNPSTLFADIVQNLRGHCATHSWARVFGQIVVGYCARSCGSWESLRKQLCKTFVPKSSATLQDWLWALRKIWAKST